MNFINWMVGVISGIIFVLVVVDVDFSNCKPSNGEQCDLIAVPEKGE